MEYFIDSVVKFYWWKKVPFVEKEVEREDRWMSLHYTLLSDPPPHMLVLAAITQGISISHHHYTQYLLKIT